MMHDPIDRMPTDDELAQVFDDDPPEPSAAHVAELRQQVAARTMPSALRRRSDRTSVATTPAPGIRQLPLSRLRVRLSLAAVVAAILIAVVTMQPFVNHAAASFHHTLQATRDALWIHGTATIASAGRTVTSESWCSPAERLAALRTPRLMHFIDFGSGLQSSYSAEMGKIWQWSADQRGEGLGRAVVQALLNDGDLAATFPFHTVSRVRRSVVRIDGRASTQYSFRAALKSDAAVGWETRVRTAPDTGRIEFWEDRHTSGMVITTFFDYPEDGPRSIYDLGAPREAEVVALDEFIESN